MSHNGRMTVMAFKAFAKVGDIKGGCSEGDHKEWIQLLSYNHGVSQLITHSNPSATQGRRSTQGADIQDFTFTKNLDQASAPLAEACCLGTKKEFPKAEVHICDDEAVVMKYTMEKVVVSNVTTSGSSDVTETVSLNFMKITWEYQPRAGGVIPGKWNLETQKND
jgi:type VI secretion system secreted protein Hcp